MLIELFLIFGLFFSKAVNNQESNDARFIRTPNFKEEENKFCSCGDKCLSRTEDSQFKEYIYYCGPCGKSYKVHENQL